MDIAKLKDNIVTETVEYRNEKVEIDIAPDVYTNDDGKMPIAEYVVKGLKKWDVTQDGKTLPITKDSLTKIIPDGLLTAIFDRILSVKDAGLGKLKMLKNLQDT
ncbi:MAG: hypothetical protein ACR2MD_01045 [Aridibacter sp.]